MDSFRADDTLAPVSTAGRTQRIHGAFTHWKLVCTVLPLLAGLLGGSCQVRGSPDERQPVEGASPGGRSAEPRPAEVAGGGAVVPPSGDSVIGPGALQPFDYTVLDSARFDLDGDATPERVEMLATVQRSAAGALLWEDGHHWAVVVRDDSLSYVLVERFLPWGRAEFAALREAPGSSPEVVVLTRAGSGCSDVEGSLALTVEKFAYEDDRSGFLREAVLEAAGSGVCRGHDGG